MSQSEIRNGRYQWWRWPFVVILPPVVALAAAFIFHWIQWFGMKMQGGYSEDGWMVLYIAPLFTAAILGWSYAWVAALTAPSAKFPASVVMSMLLAAMGGVASVAAIVGEQYPAYQAVSVSLMTFAGVCGLVGALVQIKKHGGTL
ncbi:hypothetical protein Q667_12565 [Marinobacter sp. C1S70]|uniref:hypothetical protein n=1 Tax=Marinobacter sp. C1S70 TaxID=1396859 RepID=UPI0003B86D67|nr:hypothetical protein [Marinobacter sp. C1S70]ERS89320.1 hypothetical protein Q667_12565 [Marinobacter sp. C1S70]